MCKLWKKQFIFILSSLLHYCETTVTCYFYRLRIQSPLIAYHRSAFFSQTRGIVEPYKYLFMKQRTSSCEQRFFSCMAFSVCEVVRVACQSRRKRPPETLKSISAREKAPLPGQKQRQQNNRAWTAHYVYQIRDKNIYHASTAIPTLSMEFPLLYKAIKDIESFLLT